jgi:hypothetical protein
LRQFFDDRATIDAQPLTGSGDRAREQAGEVRLAGVVYF